MTVQRLHVPDILVLDSSAVQLQAQQQAPTWLAQTTAPSNSNAPIGGQLSSAAAPEQSAQVTQQSMRFECLVAYDKRSDKNLVVKWFHDDEPEPILQLIPELNKRSVAAKYRAHIVPPSVSLGNSSLAASAHNNWQLVDAGFRLSKPNSREFGGKYTCVAVSKANDDAKWKKLTVFCKSLFLLAFLTLECEFLTDCCSCLRVASQFRAALVSHSSR